MSGTSVQANNRAVEFRGTKDREMPMQSKATRPPALHRDSDASPL